MSKLREAMTLAEVMALPSVVDIETSNRALGISRTLGYKLVRKGEYPCRVLKVGAAYRVATADLHRVLGAVRLAA